MNRAKRRVEEYVPAVVEPRCTEQIRDVRKVEHYECYAEEITCAWGRRSCGRIRKEVEQAEQGVVHRKADGQSGGKVIHLFGEWRVWRFRSDEGLNDVYYVPLV